MKRELKVRALILHNNKLLCVRLCAYKAGVDGTFWCLPGGTVDPGEALTTALHREMIEETGVAPTIGELLYIQQFSSGERDITDFFFHVTNATDYEHVDLTQTSHGVAEIEEIAFVDPKQTHILPEFLTTEDIAGQVSSRAPTKVFSRY